MLLKRRRILQSWKASTVPACGRSGSRSLGLLLRARSLAFYCAAFSRTNTNAGPMAGIRPQPGALWPPWRTEHQNPVVSKNTNELKTGAPGRFGLEVSTLTCSRRTESSKLLTQAVQRCVSEAVLQSNRRGPVLERPAQRTDFFHGLLDASIRNAPADAGQAKKSGMASVRTVSAV